MPVVTTLHDTLASERIVSEDKASSDISELVNKITFDILNDAPRLVADVEQGKVDKKLLETAIIRDIDTNHYHLGLSRGDLIKKVFDYMFGYGILQEYIEDEDISDIDGTKYDFFTIRKFGKTEEIKVNFGNEKIFETYCKLITIRNGGILNENDAHCRVSDDRYRLRINTSIYPRNTSGPALSIRKHRMRSLNYSELIAKGMINEEIAEYLRRIARTNISILFAGKGASGKTTLLRTVVNSMPITERVLVAESDSEIYPDKKNCIVQKVKKANEGGRTVTLYELINDGLTMSLDTYVIGEIVGREAYPFINAGFTGHRVLGSLHTWAPEDVMPRLLAMAKAGGATESERTLKELIGRAIDLVIYLDSYKVTGIMEVLGYDTTTDSYRTNKLFTFKSNSDMRDEYGSLIGEFQKVNNPMIEKSLRGV